MNQDTICWTIDVFISPISLALFEDYLFKVISRYDNKTSVDLNSFIS